MDRDDSLLKRKKTSEEKGQKINHLRVQLLSTSAKLPTRGSRGAAGYDLYNSSAEYIEILPHSSCVVPLGIAIQLPDATYGRIAGRSGLAFNHGLDIAAGVIDPDYRGEIKVCVRNHSSIKYTIHPGEKIAQLILEIFIISPIEQVSNLSVTERGESGFGSTGK